MAGLGERGKRLRAVAKQLVPPPAVPPFYVEHPDEVETRAIGWYMRQDRSDEPLFLGHSAIAAEIWIRRQLELQKTPKVSRKKAKARA